LPRLAARELLRRRPNATVPNATATRRPPHHIKIVPEIPQGWQQKARKKITSAVTCCLKDTFRAPRALIHAECTTNCRDLGCTALAAPVTDAADVQAQVGIQARTNDMSASSPTRARRQSASPSADGDSIHLITWQSINPPPGAGVALFPQKAVTGHIFDLITTSLPASGSYTWQVPIYVSLPIPMRA
jgi:hypothetical protein